MTCYNLQNSVMVLPAYQLVGTLFKDRQKWHNDMSIVSITCTRCFLIEQHDHFVQVIKDTCCTILGLLNLFLHGYDCLSTL
jgi:hypothetical protein